MKIVVINPILYTCENSYIKKVKSIKDTMIYNLCLEFKKNGHEVILIAAKDYEPIKKEKYDVEVIFLPIMLKKIFKPNCFPLLKGLLKTIKKECVGFDFIISSEVFSMSSLFVSIKYKKKTIIWHELAKHNNIMKKIPSKIWYNIIARIFFRNTRIVARSKNAQTFVKRYCNNVSSDYIDHGVNLQEFFVEQEKNNQFIVVSQLIERKHIDGIIRVFGEFLKAQKDDFKLIIVGTGDKEEDLKKLASDIDLINKIEFKGQLSHLEMIPLLSKSKALLINTEKDNSMLSIVEAIATATPIVTTPIPYNVDYVKKFKLGVVTNEFSKEDLKEIVKNNIVYVNNCFEYRERLSNEYHIKQFIDEYKEMISEEK